jgi:hypothetical protein
MSTVVSQMRLPQAFDARGRDLLSCAGRQHSAQPQIKREQRGPRNVSSRRCQSGNPLSGCRNKVAVPAVASAAPICSCDTEKRIMAAAGRLSRQAVIDGAPCMRSFNMLESALCFKV